MKNKILIGLVGEKGSGKETVAKIIQKIVKTDVAHIRFSDLLKETLDLWSLPITRENLQDLAIIMDKHFGEGTLANALYHQIEKLDAEIVILDGVRWDADIVLINKFKNHFLIYVTADLQTRFERITKRIEKVGEGGDFKQFMKEEQKANEVNIPRLGEAADFKIENNASKQSLKKRLLEILSELDL